MQFFWDSKHHNWLKNFWNPCTANQILLLAGHLFLFDFIGKFRRVVSVNGGIDLGLIFTDEKFWLILRVTQLNFSCILLTVISCLNWILFGLMCFSNSSICELYENLSWKLISNWTRNGMIIYANTPRQFIGLFDSLVCHKSEQAA